MHVSQWQDAVLGVIKRLVQATKYSTYAAAPVTGLMFQPGENCDSLVCASSTKVQV